MRRKTGLQPFCCAFLAWVALLVTASPSQVQAQTVVLSLNQGEVLQHVAGELLTEIYRRAGLNAKVEPSPPARNNNRVLNNQIDGEVARVGAYFEKNPGLIKVEPAYYFLVTTAFAKSGRTIVVNSPADLHQYRVGIIRGVAHAQTVTEGVPNLVVVNSVEQLFKMLSLDRIDIAVDAYINGMDTLKQLNLKDIKPVAKLAKRDLYNALIPSKADLAPRISKVIKSMFASGELASLTKSIEANHLDSSPNHQLQK